MRRQRGWINLPPRFFDALLFFAAVGLVAIIGFVVWGLWWFITHVRFV
jgi:uncharacterized membrane protein SirB2